MRYTVADGDTASALGSGDVPVLATPRLIAWMEAATVQAALPLLGADQTTVGTAVRIEHRRASAAGVDVEVTAALERQGERGRLTFSVLAVDGSGQVVASGEVERVIVDRAQFLARVSPAGT